jgi:hypothetical protein
VIGKLLIAGPKALPATCDAFVKKNCKASYRHLAKKDSLRTLMDMIENKTFDEIAIGAGASLVRTLSREDIKLFAIMSGDVNPAHVDDEYARSDISYLLMNLHLMRVNVGVRCNGVE